MQANIFNIPVTTLEVEQGPGLGAAMLAATGDWDGMLIWMTVWINLLRMVTRSGRYPKMWISIGGYMRFIGKFTRKLGCCAGGYRDRSEACGVRFCYARKGFILKR